MLNKHNSKDKIIGILQPSYLPWLGFFDQLFQSDNFVLYDDVQFDKGSWRNRNRIKTPSGFQWLTVPVLLKGKKFPIIKDVKINTSESWQKKHIKAISQNYSKATYFEEYSEPLFCILKKNWKYIIDLNIELIVWINSILKISTPIILSSELCINGSNVHKLVSLIKRLKGKYFYEGTAGKGYIDTEFFKKNEITVIFQDYEHPTYQQLYGNFLSHVSIIDLLFNCGPGSLNILTRQKV